MKPPSLARVVCSAQFQFAMPMLLGALLAGCGSSSLSPQAASPISVSISPAWAGLMVTQSLTVKVTITNDPLSKGVTFTAPAGAVTAQTATTATYTAPSAPGSNTVTATSVADPSKSALLTVGVTDLASVSTYHNNPSRDGVNSQEYALTTASVKTSSFGRLFSCAVDGAIYAQPLWVANLIVAGAKHNVIFVATQHDSVYAFDADATPCATLWHFSLIDTAHGGTPGESPVPSSPPGNLVGVNYGDITPEVGITGTPVIDTASNTLFVVSKSVIANPTPPTFFQRLHALDFVTGNEKLGAPVTITNAITVPGTGDGGTTVAFNPQTEHQRSGLALVNGMVYVSWASHEDKTPYHGWVIAYDASTLAQVAAFNTTPNGGLGGIWMSGAAPAIDKANNIFFATGNGTFLAPDEFADSIVKLGPPAAGGFPVLDSFTPSNQGTLSVNDIDLGSGGVLLLPDLPAGSSPQHLLVQVGKEGKIYLVDRDNMGGYCNACADKVLQELPGAVNGMWGMPAFWNGTIYTGGAQGGGTGDKLQAFSFNSGPPVSISISPSSVTSHIFNYSGPTPSVSSTGTTNGIVWALDNGLYGPPCCANGPAVLHAYDATNLANELWNSAQASANRDAAGNAVKFTVPTVANGKVYVGTRTEVTVYGLLPN